MGQNIEQMISQITEIKRLIAMCDQELNTSSSEIREGFEDVSEEVFQWVDHNLMNNNAVKYQLAQFVKRSVSSGQWQRIVTGAVIGGTLYGATWIGCAAIDKVSDALANKKAKKMMLSYHQELAAKQGMLVEEVMRLRAEQAEKAQQQDARGKAQDEKIRRMEALLATLENSGHLKKA